MPRKIHFIPTKIARWVATRKYSHYNVKQCLIQLQVSSLSLNRGEGCNSGLSACCVTALSSCWPVIPSLAWGYNSFWVSFTDAFLKTAEKVVKKDFSIKIFLSLNRYWWNILQNEKASKSFSYEERP